MSSHHIVKENQEPALIVAVYDALDQEYLGQLLEWSPTIITSGDSVDFFLAAGIKVDVVIEKDSSQYAQEQIGYFPMKKGLIPDALDYLIQNHYKAVNIIDSVQQPEILKPYLHLINIVILSAGYRYVYVRGFYEKWKTAGARMIMSEHQLKSFVGLKKISPDVFVTEYDGFIYIEFNTDEYVCIGEEI